MMRPAVCCTNALLASLDQVEVASRSGPTSRRRAASRCVGRTPPLLITATPSTFTSRPRSNCSNLCLSKAHTLLSVLLSGSHRASGTRCARESEDKPPPRETTSAINPPTIYLPSSNFLRSSTPFQPPMHAQKSQKGHDGDRTRNLLIYRCFESSRIVVRRLAIGPRDRG